MMTMMMLWKKAERIRFVILNDNGRDGDHLESTCGFLTGAVERGQGLNLPTSQGGRQATESPIYNVYYTMYIMCVCISEDINLQNR